MKVLTIWPEWVWSILYLGKMVENRSWKPPESLIGGRIALHAGAHVGGRAGAKATREGLLAVSGMALREGWSTMLPGGQVDYMSFFPLRGALGLSPEVSGPFDMWLRDDPPSYSNQIPLIRGAIVGTAKIREIGDGAKVPWGVPGMHAWCLDGLMIFDEPVRAKGKQRLWRMDPEMERLVLERHRAAARKRALEIVEELAQK